MLLLDNSMLTEVLLSKISTYVLERTFTVFNILNCAHDVILGRDMLQALGCAINGENPIRTSATQLVKPQHGRSSTNTAMASDADYLDYLDKDAYILNVKCETTSAKEVAEPQDH